MHWAAIVHAVREVDLRNLGSQFPGAFATAISDVTANDLAALGVHRQPNPLLARLILYDAHHFVGFDLKALNHDGRVARDRLHIEMIGQGWR